MIIIDGQIDLWEKGTPSAHHRQQPYLAEQAIAAKDAAGVDRALIHPVLWDPDSNELAIEAMRRYPDRFAIMGWFLSRRSSRTRYRRALEGAVGPCSACAFLPTTGTRNPGSQTARSTGWPAADRAGVPGAENLLGAGKTIGEPF